MGDPTLGALGLRVELTGNLAGRLAPLFDGLIDTDDAPGTSRVRAVAERETDRLHLWVDEELVFSTDDLGALVHQLTWELTQRAVRADDALVLHAALVTWHGANLVISGPSGTGKSTLTAALVRRGATYVTDEATIVDADGVVRGGFVRPIHLDRRAVELVAVPPSVSDVTMPGGGRYMLPSRWSRHALAGAATVVVLLGERDGPLTTGTSRRSEAVAHLIRESFAAPGSSQGALEILKNLSARAQLVTVRGGSLIDRAYLGETLASQEKVIARP